MPFRNAPIVFNAHPSAPAAHAKPFRTIDEYTAAQLAAWNELQRSGRWDLVFFFYAAAAGLRGSDVADILDFMDRSRIDMPNLRKVLAAKVYVDQTGQQPY